MSQVWVPGNIAGKQQYTPFGPITQPPTPASALIQCDDTTGKPIALLDCVIMPNVTNPATSYVNSRVERPGIYI